MKKVMFAITCALLAAIIIICAVSCGGKGEYERFMSAFAKAESFEVTFTEKRYENGATSENHTSFIKVDKNKVHCYLDEGDVDEMIYVDSKEGSFMYTRYGEEWRRSSGGDDAKEIVSSIKDSIKAENFTYSSEKRAYVGNKKVINGIWLGEGSLLTVKNGIATVTQRFDISNGGYTEYTVVIKNIGMTNVTVPNVK